jgi:hypothetical protein
MQLGQLNAAYADPLDQPDEALAAVAVLAGRR